jgi:hypothetical protein
MIRWNSRRISKAAPRIKRRSQELTVTATLRITGLAFAAAWFVGAVW